jgi:transposase
LKQLIADIRLDVHKETITVRSPRRANGLKCASMARSRTAGKALAATLSRNGPALRFCCEAVPCGCGIQRRLTGLEHDCVVVAPSLIPRRPGEWIKTDRQDVINLAKLDRAGELTPVGVPDQAHEVIRDLVRAAVDPMADDLASLGLDLLVGEYQRHAPNPLFIIADH